MSYCPIDEAFGHYMTEGLQPNPLESSNYQGMNSNNCQKKRKIKKKKINCNRNNTTFQNYDDLFLESPELTDEDVEFDKSIQGYSEYSEVDNFNISNGQMSMPKNVKSNNKKRRHVPVPNRTTRYSNNNSNIIEEFTNNSERAESIPIKRKSRNKVRNNVQKNEIYEYDPNDDLPLSELSNRNIVEENDTDDEETPHGLKATNSVNNTQEGGMNSQINEINNKINFILNQISNNDNEIVESQHNNIHDIILFVIFGIFVLIILESLYRLISKMVKANNILNNTNSFNSGSGVNTNPNANANANSLVSESKSFFSSDPFEKVKSFARSKE